MAANPQTAAQRWENHLSAAATDGTIENGINAVQKAPGAAAAAQKAAYLQGVQANADLWARNVANVSLSQWQQAAINKGLNRIATGAAAAQGKVAQTLTNIINAENQITATLPARGNFQQNVVRATQFMTQMHAKKGTFSTK